MTRERAVLDALMQRGVLVEIHCRCWSGQKALRPEDLGLEPSDVNEELMSLGRKNLVPKASLAPFYTLEVRARQELARASFAVPFGHYVPLEAYPELRGRLDDIIQRFDAYHTEWLPSYPGWRAEMLDEWRVAAGQAYERANGEAMHMPRGEFMADFMDRIRACYPDPSELTGRFSLGALTYQVSLPADSGVAPADLALLDAQARAQEEARAQVSRDALETAQRETQAMLTSMVREMRARATELAERLAASLRDGGTVRQQQFDSFIRFVDSFRRMNVLDDRDLAGSLDRIESEFLSPGAAVYRGEGAGDLRERFSTALGDVARLGDAPREDAKRLADRFARSAGARTLTL